MLSAMAMLITRGVCMGALIAYFHFSVFLLSPCTARDAITPNRGLKDGETIASGEGKFVLGFFSPGRSSNRYVGIWYTSESEQPVPVVWVANREIPLTDSSGTISINENGSLVITDGKDNPLWSTATSTAVRNSSARLLDTGNLVLLDVNTGETIWESFDHPGNVILPKMKVGININTNKLRILYSWKDASDPSVGEFSLGISPLKPYQVLIWSNSGPYWRSGQWNGRVFLGVPGMSSNYLNGFSLTGEGGFVDLIYDLFRDSDSNKTLFMLNSTGNLLQKGWDDESKEWFTSWMSLVSECDIYGKCGPYGVCNPLSSPLCTCIRGFEPRFWEEWNKGNWSGGCVRRNPLSCKANGSSAAGKKEDGFLKFHNMKPPDSIVLLSFDYEEECERECLRNCSCVAHAFDIGIGCMFWSGELIDLQIFPVDGVDLYLRLPASELGEKKPVKVIITVVVLGASIVCVFLFLVWRWLGRRRESGQYDEAEQKGIQRLIENRPVGTELSDQSTATSSDGLKQEEGRELPIFDFKVIDFATDNFSPANKLGGGGFGPVYKGILPGGQEVAVKRLSRSSGQGLQEFRNEVLVISRVQHKNLVRLLGYCIQGEEKMLLYEYMPNKSLDSFIFDSDEQKLDWAQRFHIIEGIARGLLYLHRDSRLKIIHRDLKASNILLDKELNPKISDFGLARIFGGNQIQAETRRVVGTYGYMSPEYAMEGRFSEKSDVFSFGVLLLEIVSGKKNTSFYNQEPTLNLLSHAWKLWNDEQALKLIDPKLGSTYSEAEVLRCIHVGLLCVQEFAGERPTMSAVTLFLGTDTATPPTPKQPAFTAATSGESISLGERESVNNVTVTMLEGR